MKLFSKKMLSILAALCILAGIAIPAGVISASADTDEEDPSLWRST